MENHTNPSTGEESYDAAENCHKNVESKVLIPSKIMYLFLIFL